jgi:hypothetical protein
MEAIEVAARGIGKDVFLGRRPSRQNQCSRRESPPSCMTAETFTVRCPKCASRRTHRSRRRSLGAHLLRLMGCRLRRCRECSLRFATIGNSVLLAHDINKIGRKFILLAAIALAVALVSLTVLWLSARQREPESSRRFRRDLWIVSRSVEVRNPCAPRDYFLRASTLRTAAMMSRASSPYLSSSSSGDPDSA